MGTPRLDHVGVVVDDLDAAAAFLLDLGFQREGGAFFVEGAGPFKETKKLRTPE